MWSLTVHKQWDCDAVKMTGVLAQTVSPQEEEMVSSDEGCAAAMKNEQQKRSSVVIIFIAQFFHITCQGQIIVLGVEIN